MAPADRPAARAQGWNAPPPQRRYGQPYPGYAPAPSAPTGYGAPPAMERPVTVRAGIGAFVGQPRPRASSARSSPSPTSTR